MVAVLCREAVNYRADADTKESLVLFDLDTIGVEKARFLRELGASFDKLEWDYYDVRREQLRIIQTELPFLEGHEEPFKRYYAGFSTLKALLAGLPSLPTRMQERLAEVKPYRRRSTAKFRVSLNDQGAWLKELVSNQAIAQQVQGSDYRSIPRTFAETPTTIIEHPEFSKLVESIATLTRQASDAVSMMVTCWQTGIVARPALEGSNSPEGIHQDGADYIVSALVVERANVTGGTSRVFGPDKCTEHLQVTLSPGQGIFQADAGSTLWHDVTPIRVEKPEDGEGVRNLFGFDIHVLDRGGS